MSIEMGLQDIRGNLTKILQIASQIYSTAPDDEGHEALFHINEALNKARYESLGRLIELQENRCTKNICNTVVSPQTNIKNQPIFDQ